MALTISQEALMGRESRDAEPTYTGFWRRVVALAGDALIIAAVLLTWVLVAAFAFGRT